MWCIKRRVEPYVYNSQPNNMNKEETAQKIVDIFFEKGAKVSKKEYNEVLEILENYISKQEVKEKISAKILS